MTKYRKEGIYVGILELLFTTETTNMAMGIVVVRNGKNRACD
jgi:hypothetical protein